MRVLAAVALLILLIPHSAFAVANAKEPAPFEPYVPKPGDQVRPNADTVNPAFSSCFDNYRFGSTPILISASLTSVAQGSPIAFTGTLTNENAYPLTDVAIYAKVFYRKNPAVKDSFGPDVIDYFLVKDKVTLTAGEVQPISLTWNVPQNASLGEYQLATFVVSHDRFNLLGLSFTTDIVGGSTKFSVVGSEQGNTKFDIYNTTIGTEVVHGAAYPPRVTVPNDGLPISVRLVNSSALPSSGKVIWKLYAWDTARAENLIDSQEALVTIAAQKELELTYHAKDASRSVYTLLAEYIPADAASQHSFQSIRFINTSVNAPRISFAGASAYPAKKGDQAYVCVHSSGTAEAENVRVLLTATSQSIIDFITFHSSLAERTYTGPIPGNINALSVPFSHNASSFVVRARVYQGDVLVDDVTIPYSCTETTEGCSRDYLMLAGGALLLVVVAWISWVVWKRRRHHAKPEPIN
jgi:hypothetical protein